MRRAYGPRLRIEATEPWTDARENDARRMVLDGKSASEIAKALGGTSRNAVLGLTKRRGWRVDGKVNPEIADAPPPRIVRSARRISLAPPVEYTGPRAEGIGIMDLTLTTCRFVVDATRHDQRYCGAWCADTEPYCAHHRRVCWSGEGPKLLPPRRERLG